MLVLEAIFARKREKNRNIEAVLFDNAYRLLCTKDKTNITLDAGRYS